MTASTPSGDRPAAGLRGDRLLATTMPNLSVWSEPHADPQPGYSVVVTYPPDLPALLILSLRTLARCDGAHRREVLAVSDPTRAATSAPAGADLDALGCPVRFIPVPEPDATTLRRIGSPYYFHWAQIVTATRAAASDHVLLHDADLVLRDPGFLDTHYVAARDAGLACRGVEPCWDPWFAAHGLGHVCGTWELVAQVSWLRSFEPLLLRSQRFVMFGEEHDFDTTLWAQTSTAPERIAWGGDTDSFRHFSFLTVTYRRWQVRVAGEPFQDEHGRLMVLRVLHDVFGAEAPPDLPAMADLVAELRRQDPEIVHLPDGWTHGLRRSLDLLHDVAAVVLTEEERSRLAELVEPFEQAVALA